MFYIIQNIQEVYSFSFSTKEILCQYFQAWASSLNN